jgi:copper resistance protein B
MKWTLIIAAAAPVVLACPVFAQTDPPAMQMPWPTSPPQTQASAETGNEDAADHSQMDHGAMDGNLYKAWKWIMAPCKNAGEVGDEPAPAPPTDHAAERFYSAEDMAAARGQLRREHGGAIISNVMLDMAELQFGDDETVLSLGRRGLDRRRHQSLRVQDRRRGVQRSDVERAEVQALYSRAIGPYFDLQAGVRYDIEPSPNRAYAVLGFEGVAPYWFETTGALFVSDEGEVSARFEGSYDARLTQRLILQPRAEINLSADDIPELEVGAGVTDVELGLRLRYDITRNFAPYVGVTYETKLGDTADYASAAGEDESDTRLVFGVRARF